MRYMSTDKLMKDYTPLKRWIFTKFHSYFPTYEGKSELQSQIEYEFLSLVRGYDPRRGVDFPGYIKQILNQRIYHWVTKQNNLHKQETTVEEVWDVVKEQGFDEQEFEVVHALLSVNPSHIVGKKRRKLLNDILVHRKTLEEIADEEGVEVRVIRLRLHFLAEKLTQLYDESHASS